ncbi:MAG: hypothetical protein KCHDKBKB_00560 [Elusimicrobia bacterium]|nr:hypothetical protein [Elusimicrobiota bacterium]
MNKKIAVSLFLLLGNLQWIYSIDIPLSGATNSGGGAKLGYVDMDKIFQVFPQTQAAKEDYAKQLKKKRDQLSAKETELKDIEGKISVLESTLKQGTSAPPSPEGEASESIASATNNMSQSIQTMKNELEAKKMELLELKKQASTELAAFESQQSQLILGKIYQALKDVALEEQVTVVVDKSSILYGESSIDLTEKLQQRVRGY